MLLMGNYANVLLEIGILENFSQLTKEQLLECKSIRIEVLYSIGGFEDALSLAYDLLFESRELKKHLLVIDAYIYISKICYRLGKLQQAIQMINKGYNYLNEFKNEFDIFEFDTRQARLKSIESSVLWEREENKKALEIAFESFRIIKKHGEKAKHIKAMVLNTIGTIYRSLGDLDNSLEYHKKSLVIVRELGNNHFASFCLNNIGLIHKDRGEIQEALDYFKECLNIRRNLGNDLLTAIPLIYIGRIYHIQGRYEDAFRSYKEVLGLLKKSRSPKYTAYTLFLLINLCTDTNKIERAERYLSQLYWIKEKQQTALIDHYYLLSKALILKESKRNIQRAKAQEIFQELVSSKKNIDSELLILSLLLLSEILFTEFQATKDDTILDEMTDISNKLLLIANNQHSYSLLARVYLLKAQLNLLKGEYQRAKQLLSKSQFLADSKGFKLLALEISKIYDMIIEKEQQWASTGKKSEKMNEIFNVILEKKELERTTTQDKPMLILFITEGGLSIYSKKFFEGNVIDDQIIGSYLFGIIENIQEILSLDEQIDRLKFKDYTILVKNLLDDGKEGIRVCYLFKGDSYPALQKLNTFIEQLRSEDLKRSILSSAKTNQTISSSDRITIEQIVQKIFA